MIRIYNAVVNGKHYRVEIEEEKLATTAVPERAVPSITPPQPQPPAIEMKTDVAATSGEVVRAPMPGTIFEITVNQGDIVSFGDTLLILEAMKMENEISSPVSGTVKAIHVKKGEPVNTGDVLVSLM